MPADDRDLKFEFERDEETVDLSYAPGEPVFGAVARQISARGWPIFPQARDERRGPGFVQGQAIRWSEEHDLRNRLPSAATVETWIEWNRSLNVALVLGPAAKNVFAIDMDVTDPELAFALREAAFEHLGPTPFVRVGQHPKVALLYRSDEGTFRNQTKRFALPDSDEPSGDAIEILADGKPLTIAGRHHRTGRYFYWEELAPMDAGPEAVPLVTGAALDAWFDACDTIRPFHSAAHLQILRTRYTYDDKRKIYRPQDVKTMVRHADWVEDANGKVVDGREQYLAYLAWIFCLRNRDLIAEPEGVARLADGVLEEFRATAELGGRWAGSGLEREVRQKVGQAARKVVASEPGRSAHSAGPAVPPASALQTSSAGAFGSQPRLGPVQRRRHSARRAGHGGDSGWVPPHRPDPLRAKEALVLAEIQASRARRLRESRVPLDEVAPDETVCAQV